MEQVQASAWSPGAWRRAERGETWRVSHHQSLTARSRVPANPRALVKPQKDVSRKLPFNRNGPDPRLRRNGTSGR